MPPGSTLPRRTRPPDDSGPPRSDLPGGKADRSPAAPAPTGIATSADPRLAGLESWRELSVFLDGYARGRDPEGKSTQGIMHITRRSLWNSSRCPACGHTFREGDVVLVRDNEDGGSRTVLHNSAEFPCAGVPPELPAPPADDTADRFAAAIARFFPVRPSLSVLRLTERHCRLAEACIDKRRDCMLCGHTVRIGDRVVRCPCGLPKKLCYEVVHHDPAQGFRCYTTWMEFGKERQRCRNPLGSLTANPNPGSA